MLYDILLAIVLIAIAAWLGLTLHPLFWLIVIVALIIIVARPRTGGPYYRRW